MQQVLLTLGDREGLVYEQHEYGSIEAAIRAAKHYLAPMECEPCMEPKWWTARVYTRYGHVEALVGRFTRDTVGCFI